MPYSLVKSPQTGGYHYEILLIIAFVVAGYFILVQTNLPRDVMKMLKMENFNNPQSTATDEDNRRSSPAVDLSSAGVPYQLPPARLGYSLSSEMTPMSPEPKHSSNKVSSTPKSTPKSSPASTPKSTPKSSPASTPKSTPKSSPASSPASSPKPTSVPKGTSSMKTVVGKKIEKFTDVNKLYSTKDSYDLKTPLSKSVCSQKCCGHYWKEDMNGMFRKDDPVKWSDVGVGKKYRTSNVTCMGDGVAPPGCRCYTSSQHELLATRAGNGSRQY